MRLVGRGHRAIRSTHRKTLEFGVGTDLTERGTCIVAVAVQPAGGAGWTPLAGPVRISIGVGDETFAFDAEANSAWQPGGPAIVRQGPLRLPGTFAVDATAAAADLPRSLVEALRDPANAVEIAVDRRAGAPALVLLAADPLGPPDLRLVGELAAADTVLVEDADARALVRASGSEVSSSDALEGRVLVVATRELPGASVDRAGRTVRTVGLAPPLAAAAAAPGAGQVIGYPHAPTRTGDLRAVLQQAPAAARIVLATDRHALPGLLALARDVRGCAAGVVVQPYADPVLVPSDSPPDFAGADRLWCCLVPDAAVGLDPAVQAAISGLLADGVATKPAARALATLTGRAQRRAYDDVVGLGRPAGPRRGAS